MEKPIIRIEEVNLKVIYMRHRGSYAEFRKKSRSMFNELFDFASKGNLINSELTKVLTIYDDNPFITQSNHLRTSVAMTIPLDSKIVELGEITEASIEGRFAIAEFNINAKEYGDAWKYMYETYAKENDVELRDAVPFEMYLEEPPRNMKDRSLVHIYIPII